MFRGFSVLFLLLKTFGFKLKYFIIIFLRSIVVFLIRITLAFDFVFYNSFRKKKIVAPVFLIGHPRGGTTFLHRFIMKNCPEFNSLCLYDFLFPAITAKKIMRPFRGKMQKAQLDKLYDPKIHKTSFFMPETEDIALFLRYFDGLLSWMYFYTWKVFKNNEEFEATLNKRLGQEKFIRYLKKIHLRSVYKSNKKVFSKSFAFIFNYHHIIKEFPDAKILFVIRDPLFAVPSFMSLVSGVQRKLNNLDQQSDELKMRFYSNFYKTSLYYYHKIHQIISVNKGNKNILVVTHKDIVTNFKETFDKVMDFYSINRTLGLENAITEQIEKQKSYKTEHIYSLEKFWLTEAKIRNDFNFIYDSYNV
jgi:omega-hydroxy-beta-dihydromenaquinone-9 sulfotransferase